MKEYVKPTIEFIELKPEERLACVTGGSGGCCSGGGGNTIQYWLPCYICSPVILCNLFNQAQNAGGHGSYGSGRSGSSRRSSRGR